MAGGIEIKTRDEIGYMREASLIAYEELEELTNAVAAGVTLEELDPAAEREDLARGGSGASGVGAAIEAPAPPFGYGIVRDYVGHGSGKKLHEDPQVPNYGPSLWSRGQPNPRMRPGMVLAIEPMINLGTHEVDTLPDGWTVVTRDGKLSSHWEHTIAVTDDGPQVLTRP